MTRHVLLVARAIQRTGAESALELLAAEVAAALRRSDVDDRVGYCFLDGADPSLHRALDRCLADCATRVILIPAQLPADRYLDTWIRRAHAHWAATRDPATRDAAGGAALPEVSVTVPLGDQPAVVDAILGCLAAPARPLAGTPGPFRSPAWEEVPGYRHHVLVCRGPRCNAYGSGEVATRLAMELEARGYGDDDVLLAQTGCLYPCNLGPVVVVHPDDVWYRQVDPPVAARIVAEHLVAGHPLTDHRVDRARHGG